MAETDGDKTQEATPYRRQKAREEGHVARSHDLVQAGILLAGLLGLLTLGAQVVDVMGAMTRHQLGGEAWLSADSSFVSGQWQSLVVELARTLLPLLGLLLAVAVGLHLAQGGFLFLPDHVSPNLSRIDPLAGLRRV